VLVAARGRCIVHKIAWGGGRAGDHVLVAARGRCIVHKIACPEFATACLAALRDVMPIARAALLAGR
jgi:hypothetical protein